jgi:hypothetical protein
MIAYAAAALAGALLLRRKAPLCKSRRQTLVGVSGQEYPAESIDSAGILVIKIGDIVVCLRRIPGSKLEFISGRGSPDVLEKIKADLRC